MKFNSSDILRIQNRAGINKFLNNLKNNSELKARVIKRFGANEAVIEINGRRIKSEFTNIIPDKSELTLKLLKKDNSTYFFKLIDPEIKSEITKILSTITLIDQDELNEKNMLSLKKLLTGNLNNLYELNLLLMNRKNLLKSSENIEKILRYLKDRGMNSTTLNLLSLFSATNRSGIGLFFIIFSITGSFKELSNRYNKDKNIDINQLLSDIEEHLSTLKDKDEKNEFIRNIISLLTEGDNSQNSNSAGKILFFHEDSEKKIHYLINKNSWFFSLNLSSIGIIDILANNFDKNININIFAESERIVEKLSESHNILASELESRGINCIIHYKNRRNIVDKLKLASTNYFFNSEIDVRV